MVATEAESETTAVVCKFFKAKTHMATTHSYIQLQHEKTLRKRIHTLICLPSILNPCSQLEIKVPSKVTRAAP